MMPRLPAKYVIYGLQRNYIELGRYRFKVVISPRFKTGADFSIELADADRRPMKFGVSYWGRKLNVEFEVTPETPDGLAVGAVLRGAERVGSFSFWVIK
jgi:hypothetical protein